MKTPSRCETARHAWMEAFDQGGDPTPEVAEHLNACEACRQFTRASERARREIQSIATPSSDVEADAALLAHLRDRRGWLRWLPDLRLAGAGVASFVVTLAVAQALSHVDQSAPGRRAEAGPPPAAIATGVDERFQERLNAWLESPAPRVLPPWSLPPASSEPQPAPGQRSSQPDRRQAV